MTRKSLHFATILGMSFKFDELLEICLRLNSVPSSGREAYANSLKRSMKAATKEGIIDTIILELQDEGGSEINDCGFGDSILRSWLCSHIIYHEL